MDIYNKTDVCYLMAWSLIQRTRSRLLQLDWKVKGCHFYCATNLCADVLTCMECDCIKFLIWFTCFTGVVCS